jgi:hypothetical protein
MEATGGGAMGEEGRDRQQQEKRREGCDEMAGWGKI